MAELNVLLDPAEMPPVVAEDVIPVAETVEDDVVVPLQKPNPETDFDYFEFSQNGRVDFSPEYFEKVMKLYGGQKKLTPSGRGGNSGKPSAAPPSFTPTKAFAIQAASEFDGRTGMGSYEELKNGTSEFYPGLKFTDEMILEKLTTMKEKGFLESLGTRLVENVPSAAAFGAGFSLGKKIQGIFPAFQGKISSGSPVIDKTLQGAQTAYTAGRFAIPYVSGIAASIFTADYGEPFGELFLGKKTLPTPDTYSIMRTGQVVADVASFVPYTFLADRAASNMLTDYFVNRLAFSTIPTKQGPVEALGRGFDFSSNAKKSFSQQWKNAQKVAQNQRTTPQSRVTYKEGVGAPKQGEFRGTRSGKEFQGPLNINDLNERGVAAVMQGKTAPGFLRMLLAIENGLKVAGKDAKNNKKLSLFYETLAAFGAAAFVSQAAKNDPFGTSETIGELAGGVAVPIFAGQATFGIARKVAPFIKAFNQNRKDMGLIRGTKATFKDAAETTRNNRGFLMVVDVLEQAGSLDSPEQIEELIKALNSAKTVNGARQTAGQASKNPAIMSMEAALARDFESLSKAQQAARQQEIDFLEGTLNQLAFAEGTEYSKEALTLAGQIKESIYEKTLNSRLQAAEQKLLNAFEQVNTSKAGVLGPDGKPLTVAERKALDNESVMELSERLSEMLKAQKNFARDRQKTLYAQVGNPQINQFFTDDGAPTNTPKFIRLFIDEDDVINESSVRQELSKLYSFAQTRADALGLNYDINLERPAALAFDKARTKMTGADSMMFFDRFVSNLSAQVDNRGIPESVTDEMINRVRQERNQISGNKNGDRYKLYDSFMDALIEKKTTQGVDVSVQAENAARQAQVNDFDAQAGVLFENLNEGETQSFNNFLLGLEDLNPSQRASEIRGFVAENSMRPETHPGKIIAEKMDYLAKTPVVTLKDQTEQLTAGISLSELRQIRTEALGIARDGQKTPEVRRAAGLFASAVEDDLANFANLGGEDIPSAQLAALKDANSFTKAFADVFYRSYVGDALSQTRSGSFRLAPETIGSQFTTSRFDPNFLKIRDVEEVGKFMRNQGIPGGEGSIDSIHGVMERIIRTARAESIDPETNVVSQKRLNSWLKKNEQLSEIFPEIFADLRDFNVAKAAFDQTTLNNSASRAMVDKQINFTTLLRNKSGEIRTNPASAISEALSAGKDQIPALARLLDVIPKTNETRKSIIYEITDPASGIVTKFYSKKEARSALETIPGGALRQKNLEVSRQEAIDGFKSSLFEYFVFGASGGRGQNSSIQDPLRLYRDLFEKKVVVGGKTSTRRGDRRRYDTLTGYLKKQGIFNDQELSGLETTLKALISAKSPDAAGMLGESFEQAKPILDFALAIGGSAIGTKSQSLLTGGTGGPGSIIAAGKGAEAMRNIFLRMPQGQRMLFTAELMQNPQLMAKMLRNYGEGNQKKGVIASVTDWLKTNGFSIAPRRAFSTSVQDGSREEEPGQVNPGIPSTLDFSKLSPSEIRDFINSGEIETKEDLYKAREILQNSLPTNDQQGAFVPPPVQQRPSPVVPPTTQASAVLSPAPAPASSGPVDRTKYAALFPNDSISGMMKTTQQMSRGGIASLMR